jgi:hypothetical protein
VKTGLLAAGTLILFLGLSFMNLTNLSFFVHQRFGVEFSTLAPLTAAVIAINFIAKLMAKKVVFDYGYLRTCLVMSAFCSILLAYTIL